ncbi:class I SAM-dependent RNA methyltransferase [Candidatus Viridilinea mediisalina]|uniref:RNA methyltransferase n=1 Tax=Candidatus Viridilinea mediisalina TaxID=2024553 RepID=A0A2A6RLJ4_9CHLR|nr:methyltransferase [Candidatus Viridilinea mediisalina]PDW03937.1 RNA methyltransferase [Candidatus Viridilinea mediisalina]
MTLHDQLELRLDGIAQGGAGVGRHDGLVVFATGGLPGELVRVRLYERKSSYMRGVVSAVLEASPDRVAPTIAAGDHAPWQQIAYPAQLRFKQTILREQLERLAGLADLPLEPIIAAPQPWGYRNSVRLHGDGAALGYHASASRTVVPLTHDPLLLPVLNEALGVLTRQLPPNMVQGVTLRGSRAFGYALAQLEPHPAVQPAELERFVSTWRAAVPSLAGVVSNGATAAMGASTLHEELAGLTFSLSPTSFFQVNLAQAERMVALVLSTLQPLAGQRILDLYSGAGAFALPLAAAGAAVTAIESGRDAIMDGRRSAEMHGITNVRWIHAPVERALPALDETYTGVILDPPRRGCHPVVLQELVRLRVPRLVYISCHPAILARDLPPLLQAGYHVALLQPFDFFPQTPHIETVVVLELH